MNEFLSQYGEFSLKHLKATDDAKVIDKTLDSDNVHIRIAAARHPKASKENIDKALNDKNVDVRIWATLNPNATREHLHKARNDKDLNVRDAVNRHPARLKLLYEGLNTSRTRLNPS